MYDKYVVRHGEPVMTREENLTRYNYLRIEQFTRTIRKSATLTQRQKDELWRQAKNGDLDGAMQSYKNLVSVYYSGDMT